MKENNDGNDTNVGSMENSIKEDIILLKDFTEGNFKRDKLEYYKGSYKMGYFYYKDIQQAIERVLSDYKSLQKENEELKNKNKTLEELLQGTLYEMYKYYRDLANSYQGNCISKEKVKDKVKKLKEKEESGFKSYEFAAETHLAIQSLQELLEESEEK